MKGNFQLTILIVFIIAAVLGVLVFSGAIPIGGGAGNKVQGTVVLWGTLSSQAVSPALNDFNSVNKNVVVKYVQKDSATFDQDLLEALASGTGPDLFFLPDSLAYHYSSRIFTIPYQSFPLASFQSAFAGAGEVFLTSKGIIAFPILIDPMVMYYNRSMLDSNNIVNPPAFWDELVNLVPVLTKKDQDKKIIKSAVALGQFSNVTHAKDILATLFMQVGSPIISEKDSIFSSALLGSSAKVDLGPVLQFYTDFANPLSASYSWNKSLPESINAFSSEDLTFYFGYASELSSLINRNPNQNFLAAPLPQFKNSSSKLTFAHVTGVAISSFSKNPSAALAVAGLLSNGTFPQKLATALSVAPARRDLLAVKPTDAFFPTFYSSALFARSWLDPAPVSTDDIFQRMIDNVLSNSMTAGNSIGDASSKMGLLLIAK